VNGGGARGRVILHVDLDAFYASVEQRDNPELRGKPVIVGWPGRRGVVCAASYEARPSGVRSAMSMVEAARRCPEGIVVAPRMRHYSAVSAAFFEILSRYSPLVEGLSLDEAFLDLSGTEALLGPPREVGARIKAEVRSELGIVASVGIAPVKFAAKIASDFGKPDGLLVVSDGELSAFLQPLPVGRLWGVGKVSGAILAKLGIELVGDLLRVDESQLAQVLGGSHAAHLIALARGEDPREVVPSREPVSIGHEETFERDLRDTASIERALLGQCEEVCRRMRAEGYGARTVTLKVKFADHQLVTRQTSLTAPTADAMLVMATVRALLGKVPGVRTRGVRLTGISLGALEEPGTEPQLMLAGIGGADEVREAQARDLGRAIDSLSSKFGRGTVTRAALLDAARKK
jgi:DNA polymerase-4